MPEYPDGKVAIFYDLGSVCNRNPAEGALPYVVRAHHEMGMDEFNRLSELKNTIDRDYRQGDMSYNDITRHVQEEIGKIFRGKDVETSQQYVAEILGATEASTPFLESIRRGFREWMFNLPERKPLVDPNVRTGCQLLEDAGVNLVGVTDEPYCIAEGVASHLLGFDHPLLVSTRYRAEEGRFTGEVVRIEDKGAVVENYLQQWNPQLAIAVVDSPRDKPMGEVEEIDRIYVVDPDDPVRDEMLTWASEQENARGVRSPVTALDHIYGDIVEHADVSFSEIGQGLNGGAAAENGRDRAPATT